MTIYFYSNREEPYGCFSSFSRHGVLLDDRWWPTNVPGDYYWGCGKDGSGLNKLGEILEAMRSTIQMAKLLLFLPMPGFSRLFG